MQKQLGKIRTVRVRSVEKRTHGSKRVSINVPSSPLMPQTNQAYVLNATSAAVPNASTVTAKDARSNVPSSPLMPQANRTYVPRVAIPETPTTTTETNRGYATTGGVTVPTIPMLFAAWRTYRARMRQRREAVRMLAHSCVLRPVDVELRYTISPQKLGACIENPDIQPYTETFRDIEPTLYLQPVTANMRGLGKQLVQLLQWLRQELTAKYTQHVWRDMEIVKRQ